MTQETRRWDEANAKTLVMRSKEAAHDYRYFPDPDLVRLQISRDWVEEVRGTIPELPDARKERYTKEYGLPSYDAEVITISKETADFFDEAVSGGADAKAVSNWLMGEVMAYLNANDMELNDTKLTPDHLGGLIQLIEKGTISNKIAKKVFKEMIESGKDPQTVVEEKGLVQISDEGELQKIVDEVIEANPQSIEDFKNGKDRALGFLVGQIMKATKGKANPQVVNELIRKSIG